MATMGGLFVASLGLVSAHGGDTAKIHSCVNNSSGTIKIVGANDNCNNNESALDWNITGVAGPAGAEGPQGPAGAPGSGSGTIIVGNVASNGAAQGAGYTSSFNAGTGCYELVFAPTPFPGATPVWTNVTPFAVSGQPVSVLFVADEENVVGTHRTEVCFIGGQQASFNFISGQNGE